MAFQIVDDILDYQGDVESIGKNVGGDLAEGKMTLPLIFARDHVGEDQRSLICDAITHKSKEHFCGILSAVQASGGIDYSMERARMEADLAVQALEHLPESRFKSVMVSLADFSVSRIN